MFRFITKHRKALYILALIAVFCTSQPAFAQKKSYDSRKIRFSITGGVKHRFDALQIVGPNQYNEITTWKKSYPEYRYIAETSDPDYWWRDTLVIKFHSEEWGWKQCVIDYLSMPAGDSKFVDVTYDGKGCNGDSGSAAPVLEKEFNLLYKFIISDEDSLELVREIDSAMKPLECATEIASGLAANGVIGKTVSVIKVTSTCGNLAMDKVNQILKPYYNSLERK